MARKKRAIRANKNARPRKKALSGELEVLAGEGEGLLSEILTSAPPTESKPTAKPAEELAPPAAVVREAAAKVGKVVDSYGQTEIVNIKDKVLPMYRLKLPELTKQELKLLETAKEKAIEEVSIDLDKISDPVEHRRILMREVLKILESEAKGMYLSSGRLNHLGEAAVRDMIGYGQLDSIIADDQLEDILVTAVGKPVYVYHRKYGMCSTNVVFESEESIKYLIDKMARVVGRRIDQQTPLLDARLPDGSRVNATIPPVSLDGPTISIRKFRKDPLTVIDILNLGTLSTDLAAFLWLVVDGFGIKPANILFAGGTGCGKTTMLNAAITFVPERERILSIEDTAELQLSHKHWVRFETRPPNVEGRGEITMNDLVKNALRMRPDRMIVGEVRGPEAQTMFTAMNTGHDGCCGTLHSNSAAETISRLTEPPMAVAPIMIPALDIIVMQQRIYHRQKGQIRRVTEVSEVTGLEGGKPQLSRIFKWNPRTDVVEPTGVPSKIKRTIAEFSGISGNDIEIELQKRATVLEWMKHEGMRNIFEVGRIIQEYYLDPAGMLKRVRAEKGTKRR
ncbi:MAG: ATPase, T2SS/T4P/T4SS family [Candidatus Hadarchaeaceae archaeon]|nr:ATPase, T2SS/T4P/T4SS family [Hadesarchaea archaeon]MDH5685490.1 ATPase, T2SS/T4P/T4SS family [Hadesarchaea archaeon]